MGFSPPFGAAEAAAGRFKLDALGFAFALDLPADALGSCFAAALDFGFALDLPADALGSCFAAALDFGFDFDLAAASFGQGSWHHDLMTWPVRGNRF